MTVLAAFPDAELLAMDLLEAVGETVTATPSGDLADDLIQVERIGGPDDGITDRPRIRVTVYGKTRASAWTRIRAVQAVVAAAGGTMVSGENLASTYPGGVLIDTAATVSGPQQVPESGRGSRMIEYVFELSLRRPWW